jgi:hypothetical protein
MSLFRLYWAKQNSCASVGGDGVSSRCSSPAGITRIEIGQRDLV